MPVALSPTNIPNLLRAQNGTYYGRSRIGGKQRTVSLKVKSRRVAEMRLRDWLQELAAGASLRIAKPAASDGWGAAVRGWLDARLARPDLSEHTHRYYRQVAEHLSAIAAADTPPKEISTANISRWWQEFAAKHSANIANVALSTLREIFRDQITRGLRRADPTAGLRKMTVSQRRLDLPSPSGFARIVENIAATQGRHAKETARMVRWLAYSGMRIGEMQTLRWADVAPAQDGGWTVTVSTGKQRGRSASFRRVPAIPPLVALIQELRCEWEAYGGPDPEAPLFRIITPRIALANACRRLGVAHLRVHDLRHLFATACIEAGVDIPTVSRWLGHRDGGQLALRTYGHLRDHHSTAQAALVRF